MAKYVFECLSDYSVEIPAAILETRLEKDGAPVQSLEIPARVIENRAGQKVTCYNKKDAAVYRANLRWKEE